MIDLKKDARICSVIVEEIEKAQENAKGRNEAVALTKQVAMFAKDLILNYRDVCNNMIGISGTDAK